MTARSYVDDLLDFAIVGLTEVLSRDVTLGKSGREEFLKKFLFLNTNVLCYNQYEYPNQETFWLIEYRFNESCIVITLYSKELPVLTVYGNEEEKCFCWNALQQPTYYHGEVAPKLDVLETDSHPRTLDELCNEIFVACQTGKVPTIYVDCDGFSSSSPEALLWSGLQTKNREKPTTNSVRISLF
jgi:hypothetical protein